MTFTPIKKDRLNKGDLTKEYVTITTTSPGRKQMVTIRLSPAILKRMNISRKGPIRHLEVYQDPDNLRLMLHAQSNPGPHARKVGIKNQEGSPGELRIEATKVDPKIRAAILKREGKRLDPFPHDITTADQGLNNRIFIEVNHDAVESR